MLVGEVTEENLPDEWVCSMNSTDPLNNNCDESEKAQAWYEKTYYSNADPEQSPATSPGKAVIEPAVSKRALKEASTDAILDHLLRVTAEGKQKTLVCNHYFHEALMETTQSSDELEKVRQVLVQQKVKEEFVAAQAAAAAAIDSNAAHAVDDECIIVDAILGKALALPPVEKAPSPSPAKTTIAPDKSRPTAAKLPSPKRDKLEPDKKPSIAHALAAASEQTDEKSRRVSPNSLDDSCDEIIRKEPEQRKRLAISSEIPKKKPRATAVLANPKAPSAVETKKQTTAAALPTGACKDDAIDLIESSDEESSDEESSDELIVV